MLTSGIEYMTLLRWSSFTNNKEGKKYPKMVQMKNLVKEFVNESFLFAPHWIVGVYWC